MYPRLSNIYKKFNGEEYVHYEWQKTRIDAEHVKTILQAQGYKVRITEAKNTQNDTYYAIWKNPITSIEWQKDYESRHSKNLSTISSGRF